MTQFRVGEPVKSQIRKKCGLRVQNANPHLFLTDCWVIRNPQSRKEYRLWIQSSNLQGPHADSPTQFFKV